MTSLVVLKPRTLYRRHWGCPFYAVGPLLLFLVLYLLRYKGGLAIQRNKALQTEVSDGVMTVPGNISSSSVDTAQSQLYSLLSRDVKPLEPQQRPSLTDTYLDRFIVVPEYKLLFCYTEKVGCSMFNHLFRMLRLLHPNVRTNLHEAKYLASNTWFRNTPSHHNISKSDLEDILINQSWTKAVFFRDPATRFLSAYRSKCVLHEDARRKNHCSKAFGRPVLPWGSISFDRALFKLSHNTDHVFEDEHFAPAHRFCGGLGSSLHYYDFVHQLRTTTSADDIRRLLSIVGADPNTTDYLIDAVVRTGGTALEDDQAKLNELYPKGDYLHLSGSRTQRKDHNTGSNQGGTLESSYGNDDKLQFIWDLYKGDYDLFELPRLTLKELQVAGV